MRPGFCFKVPLGQQGILNKPLAFETKLFVGNGVVEFLLCLQEFFFAFSFELAETFRSKGVVLFAPSFFLCGKLCASRCSRSRLCRSSDARIDLSLNIAALAK